MKVERENTKAGWESEVLFQIPLCSLLVSYCVYRCKTTKWGREKYASTVFISSSEATRQELQFIPKSFRYKAVSLPIIRADRKIWL